MFGFTRRTRPARNVSERKLIVYRAGAGTVFRLDTNAVGIGNPDSYESIEAANATIERVLARREATAVR